MNKTYALVATIVRIYMVGALVISFNHVITASGMLGLTGWQAWTVPFFIDGFAILGMIGRSARFAPETQAIGFRLQIGAGLLSLAANVYAGHTIGERLYGVLIVAGFVTAEWYSHKLRPVATKAEAVKATRSAAATKAAATRKANAETAKAASKAKAERARIARETKALKAAVDMAEATRA